MCIIHEISRAKAEELDELLQAVLKRYREVYPDWEIITVSLEKAVDKKEQQDRIIRLMEKMKET